MQENKSKLLLPLKICQRLLSFIVNNLIPRGLKRVTTYHSLHQASTTVPMVAAKLNDNECNSGFKVQVHYIKNDNFSSNDKLQEHEEENSVQAQTKEEKPILTITAPESVPTKVLSVRDVEEEERIRKMKGKSIISTEEMTLPSPSLRKRQVRPLFDVAVNINEKSDAFIRTRKEAMRRNYMFETKTF
ncbi:hypothetical protein L484_025011 [Morus notabilis]|uniref:Uncharacterized protein n=1 Tax=Morus notabilis TaxID=981085 RepID=W9R6Y1_9ROSA|nr:hypothetical protein L484_025011 [Morus notabilis]